MSDDVTQTDPSSGGGVRRCPHCDAVVEREADRCLMCGEVLPEILPISEQTVPAETAVLPEHPPILVHSIMREKEAPITFWLTAVFGVVIILLGALVLRFQDPNVTIALAPSSTPLPPTPSNTPTWTPLPTTTSRPTSTPTRTPLAAPTATPAPDRIHNVAAGETLIGLSLRYRVSVESITEVNELTADAGIQAGQSLLIPWPTPTPPLVQVGIEVNGESVIANPEGCQRHEVRGGDSISSIAAQYDIEFLDLFMAVNRLTENTVLQPGDTLCIPEIIYGGSLPPTPGPSPTSSPTPPPTGPVLLFPIDGIEIDTPELPITLQWTAVKNLEETEWYMVEWVDMDLQDSPAHRGFTRDSSFQVPVSWRPVVPETHRFRWQVRIVQVTRWRADGLPIYSYGGESSPEAYLFWLGAVPTPTPTPVASATPSQE